MTIAYEKDSKKKYFLCAFVLSEDAIGGKGKGEDDESRDTKEPQAVIL